jgi:hypothetical protein
MQVEIRQLDNAVASELMEFTHAVAENRVTKEEATTFADWFKLKAGKEGAMAVGGILKDVATGVIADIIRKTMIG